MARRSKTYTELGGVEDMRRAFARLDFAALREAKAVIQESAEELEGEAKGRLSAQVDEISGRTMESLKIVYRDAGLMASIGSGYFNARFKEQGTTHEPAKPFLNPAFEIVRPKYLARLAAALNKAGKEASV